MSIRIGINGFGRIGRLAYREALRRGGFEVVGINDLVPADNLAVLIKASASRSGCPCSVLKIGVRTEEVIPKMT